MYHTLRVCPLCLYSTVWVYPMFWNMDHYYSMFFYIVYGTTVFMICMFVTYVTGEDCVFLVSLRLFTVINTYFEKPSFPLSYYFSYILHLESFVYPKILIENSKWQSMGFSIIILKGSNPWVSHFSKIPLS